MPVSEALRVWASANPIAARQRVADILGTSLYYVTQTAPDVLAQYIAEHDPDFAPAVESAALDANMGAVAEPPPPPPPVAPTAPVATEPRTFDPYGQPQAASGASPAAVQPSVRTATATPALPPIQAAVALTPQQQQEKDYLDRFNAGAAAQGGGTLSANFAAVAPPPPTPDPARDAWVASQPAGSGTPDQLAGGYDAFTRGGFAGLMDYAKGTVAPPTNGTAPAGTPPPVVEPVQQPSQPVVTPVAVPGALPAVQPPQPPVATPAAPTAPVDATQPVQAPPPAAKPVLPGGDSTGNALAVNIKNIVNDAITNAIAGGQPGTGVKEPFSGTAPGTSRPVESGLEAKAAAIAGGLSYDVDAQIADREAEIDALFDQGRQSMADLAVMTPGREIGETDRNLQFFERDRALAKLAARNEVREKAGAEQRANIETISNLLTAREQSDIAQAHLKISERAQEFGENVTEAQITGVYYKDPGSFEDFQKSFGAKAGEAAYDESFDFDGNGDIDYQDFKEYSRAAQNKSVKTLDARRFQADLAQRGFENTVVKSGLMGTFEGQQTVADKQRTFDNRMTEAQIFGGAAPVTYTQGEFQAAFGTEEGDPRYRAEFDLTGDGKISFQDFTIVASRTEDLGGGMLMFTPPGPQTVAARALGLDEKKLTEASRQFNVDFGQRQSEFISNFSGYAFERTESGDWDVVRKMVGKDPITGEPIYREITGLEREKFNTDKDQFNKSAADEMFKFAEALGFSKEELKKKLEEDRDGRWSALFASLFASVAGVISSRKANTGTGVTGGQPGNSGTNPFTVFTL